MHNVTYLIIMCHFSNIKYITKESTKGGGIAIMPRGRMRLFRESSGPECDKGDSPLQISPSHNDSEDVEQMLAMRITSNGLLSKTHKCARGVAQNSSQFTLLQSERALIQRLRLANKLTQRKLRKDTAESKFSNGQCHNTCGV